MGGDSGGVSNLGANSPGVRPSGPLALDRLLCPLTSASLTVNRATAPSSQVLVLRAPRRGAGGLAWLWPALEGSLEEMAEVA